jgi:hypothetical protein
MPQDILLPATNFTPEVDFRFSQNQLSLRGECYPENAAAFFAPLITATDEYLQGLGGKKVQMRVQLAYFNSSSTKLIFAWLGRFNEYGHDGSEVVLDWVHDSDDDTIQEFGLELQSDFPAIQFRLLELA